MKKNVDAYVTLGLEWEYAKENDVVLLSDVLKRKMFLVTDTVKVEILDLIHIGVTTKELNQKYGAAWNSFEEDLLKENVIYYSDIYYKFRDVWSFGGKTALFSSFMPSIPRVWRLSIDIGLTCNLDCDFCNADTQFPCMVCNKSNSNNLFSCEQLLQFLGTMKPYNLSEIYLTGADPLTNTYYIDEIINFVHNNLPLVNIYVVTNGLKILTNVKMIETWAENNTHIILQIIGNDSEYIRDITKVIKLLDKYAITYKFVFRENAKNTMEIFESMSSPIIFSESIESLKLNKTSLYPNNINIPSTLYINTVNKVRNLCVSHKMHVFSNGDVAVCNGFSETIGNIAYDETNMLIDKLSVLWRTIKDTPICEQCSFQKHCTSCLSIKQKNIDYPHFCSIY